jgi:hypothetical protein
MWVGRNAPPRGRAPRREDRMTRATVIVSLWLLLTGGIGDAVLQGDRSPFLLLSFYGTTSAMTAVALWLQFRDEGAPSSGLSRRRRNRLFKYD